MDFSATVLASGSAFTLISSCGLLLFGRGKNGRESPDGEKTSAERPAQTSGSSGAHVEITEHKENHASSTSSKKRLIPQDRLEKSKKELRTVMLEKELVSAALTRLFEAEAAGEITKEERDVLGQKYREELKVLNYKIGQIDAFIEVGDLETLRDQLLQLVSEKIDAIERRIERTQKAAEPLIKEILSKGSDATATTVAKGERPQVPDISDLLISSNPKASESPSAVSLDAEIKASGSDGEDGSSQSEVAELPERRPITVQKRKTHEADGQVEELQKELLEALDRLEKLDVET